MSRPVTQPLPPPEPGDAPSRLCALVVDDEPFFTGLLASHLKAMGIDAVAAHSGEDAVEQFAARAFDLVLMDIVMPGMGGLEATRALRASGGTRWVPIILVSALADDQAIAEGLASGADDYINKPLRAAFFEAKIRSMARSLRMRQRLEVAAGVFEHIRDGVVITDPEQRILDVNPAFTQIMGYSREELVGKTPRLYSASLNPPAVFEEMWRQLREQGFWQGEIINRRKDGVAHTDFVSIVAVKTAGAVRQYVGIVSRLNIHRDDVVTDLPGRRALRRGATELMATAARAGRRVALVALDIDHFKEVNAAFGFEVGDLLLRDVAHRLTAFVGTVGRVYRTGNDEFAILVPEADDATAFEELAEGLPDLLAEPFNVGREVLHVTASVGAAFFPDDANEPGSLLTGAEQAMRKARSAGGGRSEYFVENRRQQARERRRLIDELRGSVSEGQLRLVYQPVVALGSRRIVSAEALLRWQHPERGLLMPDAFIGAAERSGLIRPIGQWVLAQAVRDLPPMRERVPGFRLGINVSAVQLVADDFDARRFLEILEGAGVPPSAFCLEFTEGILLRADDAVRARLSALREAGVQFALDDYGTGYSSLTYLRLFPVDVLKIDQAFVRADAADGTNRALCDAIIAMSHSLGVQAVAEGIETEAQHERLAALRCAMGQGYLYGKPMPADDLLRWMDSETLAP